MVSKEKKIIFLLPPKTASNSLVQTLMNNGLTPDSQSKKYPISKIHLKLDEIMDRYDIESLEGYKVIQVTRDPYLRFMSSYFHQIRMVESQNVLVGKHDFTVFLNHLSSTINSPNFIKDFYGDDSFVNWDIDNNSTWGGIRLYHSQHSWKNVDCNYYHFKLEDILNDISGISNLVGLDLPPLITLNKNPLRVSYDKYLTDTNKKIIRNMFSIDFDTFSY
jgi:hypothetical protein